MTDTKRKLITSLCAMVALLASFVYGTYAYFTETVSSESDLSIFTGGAGAEIYDVTLDPGTSIPVPDGQAVRILPGFSVNKTVKFRNTGDYPLYVRVNIDYEITLSDKESGREDEINYSLISADIDSENWIMVGEYYYYKHVLNKGQSTEALMDYLTFSEEMDNLYKDATILCHINMQVVQSNNNGTNVLDAQGWPSEEGGNG